MTTKQIAVWTALYWVRHGNPKYMVYWVQKLLTELDK